MLVLASAKAREAIVKDQLTALYEKHDAFELESKAHLFKYSTPMYDVVVSLIRTNSKTTLLQITDFPLFPARQN